MPELKCFKNNLARDSQLHDLFNLKHYSFATFLSYEVFI